MQLTNGVQSVSRSHARFQELRVGVESANRLTSSNHPTIRKKNDNAPLIPSHGFPLPAISFFGPFGINIPLFNV